MSISSAYASLKQINSDIERHEKERSGAEAKVANLEKQITEKEKEISKCKNESSLRQKQYRLKSLKDSRDKAKENAAKAGTKLADLTIKRHKAENALRVEQQKENDKKIKSMQHTISSLTTQLTETTNLRQPNMIMQCVRPLIENYPDALGLYDAAADKYINGDSDRNMLDDMRLCFEKVLQAIFSNDKSLENQMIAIGGLLKGANVSAEFRNLLNKAIDYYTKYQNTHVKHDNNINPYEVSFIVEFTCILMKQMIEQFGQEVCDLDSN